MSKISQEWKVNIGHYRLATKELLEENKEESDEMDGK